MIAPRHGTPTDADDPGVIVAIDSSAEPAGDLVEALAALLVQIDRKRQEREGDGTQHGNGE